METKQAPFTVYVSFKVRGWQDDAVIKPVEGWAINPRYDFVASKSAPADSVTDAYAQAEIIRIMNWNNTKIGDNEVGSFGISVTDNATNQMVYFIEFKPRAIDAPAVYKHRKRRK